MNEKNKKLYSMVITAVLLAIGMILPFLTGQLQTFGKLISPLHIPVLICGLCCGWQWGLGLGIVLPILRGLTLGMPPFPVVALPMAFELGAYGLLTGLLYPVMIKFFKKKNHLPPIVCSLLIAMICGRIIGGAAKALFIAIGVIGSSSPYTLGVFFTSYFVDTAVGALIHLIIIPVIVIAIERARLSPLTAQFGK